MNELETIEQLELKIFDINTKLDRHIQDHWAMIAAVTDEINEIRKNLGGK
jgi:hypothetical protein